MGEMGELEMEFLELKNIIFEMENTLDWRKGLISSRGNIVD